MTFARFSIVSGSILLMALCVTEVSAQQRPALSPRPASASRPASSSPSSMTNSIGPFTIYSEQAAFSGYLSRIEKDTLWVWRQNQSGAPMLVGVHVDDVTWMDVPAPPIFAQARNATTEEQFQNVHKALDSFISRTAPFRKLPGMRTDEALLLKGRVYDKQGKWAEALRIYETLMALPYTPNDANLKPNARVLAGCAYAHMEDYERAVEYLGGIPLPEDDERLLSDMLFALGTAFVNLENYDDALMSFLPLVVFYPYVGNNEVRGLEAALGCYAHMEEWSPLYTTIQWIQRDYPNTPAAETAAKFSKDYAEQLVAAGEIAEAARSTRSVRSISDDTEDDDDDMRVVVIEEEEDEEEEPPPPPKKSDKKASSKKSSTADSTSSKTQTKKGKGK